MEFSELVGKTLTKIEVGEYNETIRFTDSEGVSYLLYHEQDCCESVGVEDICGDLKDLIGNPLRQAEESTQDATDTPCGMWTFYRMATVKGSVVIRWWGASEYYSVAVSFKREEPKKPLEVLSCG